MIVNLRAHPQSIKAALLRYQDPLRIVRVVNHALNWGHCIISLTKPAPRRTQLSFTFQGKGGVPSSVLPCLTGVVPELFNCDEIVVGDSSETWRVANPRDVYADHSGICTLDLQLEGSTSLDTASLTLINYHRNFVLPDLASPAEVIARLRRDTLMDCGDPRLGERAITVRLLASDSQRLSRVGYNSRLGEQLRKQGLRHCRFKHLLEPSQILVDLLVWAEIGALENTRVQYYSSSVPISVPEQRFPSSEMTEPIRRCIDAQARQFLGVSLEVCSPPEVLSFDLDDSVTPDGPFQETWRQVLEWIVDRTSSPELAAVLGAAVELKEVRIAEELAERQRRVQEGKLVYFRGKALLQEPKSEKDVLALYFKLEGAGALPLASCQVLEHTAAKGTDAIGHFQVDATEAPHRFGLIEFEPDFSQFVIHGHSLRHVDLVICWTTRKEDPLTHTDRPWLAMYTDPSLQKTVPVVVLSRIPGLEVRHA